MVTYKVLGQDGAGHTSSRPAAAGCCVELTGLVAKRPSLLPALGKAAAYTGGPERKARPPQLEQ